MNEEYQGIGFAELLKNILRNWWLILLLTGASIALSYYVTTERIEPVYQASATLFIGKESGSIVEMSLSDLQMSNQLISDYSELIKTNLVTEQVIEDLALLASPEDLKECLGVEIIKESRFMLITFKDPNAKVATEIVNKISGILTEKAVKIVGAKNIQVVDYAKIPTIPVSPNIIMNLGIAGVLGLMVALFVIILRIKLNITVQKREDIEKELQLLILGTIPKFKGGVRI